MFHDRGPRTGLAPLAATLAILTTLPACNSGAPDPAVLREKLAHAESAQIWCDYDGIPVEWTISDPTSLADMARMLEFQGKPSWQIGKYSTTDVFEVTIIRQGREEELFTLIAGDRVFFGPKSGYYVKLKDRELRRTLLQQARQHLPDPLPDDR